MYNVHRSSDHTIVFSCESRKQAQDVHDWYEDNTQGMYSDNKSKYYIKYLVTNPNPLEIAAKFQCVGHKYHGEGWDTAIYPTWEAARALEINLVQGFERASMVVGAMTASEAREAFIAELKAHGAEKGN